MAKKETTTRTYTYTAFEKAHKVASQKLVTLHGTTGVITLSPIKERSQSTRTSKSEPARKKKKRKMG